MPVNEDSAIAIDDEGIDAPAAPPANEPEVLAPIAHVALPAGVSQRDFDAVMAFGREKGQLTQDEVIETLHAVELTPEVLTTLIERVTAAGVVLVDEEDDDEAVVVAPRRETKPTHNNGVRPGG